MKKVLSFVLCIAIMCSCIGASADTATAGSVEKVLVAVKQKLDVPEELTEFTSGVNTYDKKVTYDFNWTDKENKYSLNVSSDSEGRITDYYYYGDEYSDKRIPSYTKQQVIDFAMEFVQKTLPECFADSSDILVFDPLAYSVSDNLRYSITFKRQKNGVDVRGNAARVTVCINNDNLFIKNMSAYIDYDTEFDIREDGGFDYTEAYKTSFPAEMIYRNDYTYYRKDDTRDETMLVYRIKDNDIGYITAEKGEVVEPDADAELYRFSAENSAVSDTASGGGSSQKDMLTEQEIAELETVENLMSEADIREILKNLPYVTFDEDFKVGNIYLSKNRDNEYFYRIYYNNLTDEKVSDYKYMNVKVNAHNGTITYLNNSSVYSDTKVEALTQEQKDDADKKIGEFLAVVAGSKMDSVYMNPAEYYNGSARYDYVRLVNGIKYINNTIYANFNVLTGEITSYSCNFTDSEFADPSAAIGYEAAYNAILEYAPIKQIYIKHNGKFVKCYSLSKQSIELDALNGNVLNDSTDAVDYNYTDVEKHWAREAIQKLAEIQIGIAGDEFLPDNTMTQYELLKFLCGAMWGKYYLSCTEEELYENESVKDLIHDTVKAADAPVTREDAFVYMIRIAGLEKVAKLEGIYKVEYADGDDITNGKLGYAAILSGMHVINGNGGYVRPQDNITRAEAATMIYKYLLTF